jgi:hypothetical protein
MDQFSEEARFQRYRLMVISTWPESEVKRASLASAQAGLERAVAFAHSDGIRVAAMVRARRAEAQQFR